MARDTAESDWREKVNPIFSLAIQLIQMFPRLLRSKDEGQRRRVLIEACDRAISLLPDRPSDMTDIDMSDWQEKMASEPQTAWLSHPAICDAFARLLGRLKAVPKDIFTKASQSRIGG